jgi:hypothetical protein
MPYQIRNDEHVGLQLPDMAGNEYRFWHEPFGDIGVWNGQFEQGSDAIPEGWEVYTYAGGSVTRVSGGLAGNYCFRGGQAGAGAGGYIISLRYIPVDMTQNYYLSAAFTGASANSRVSLGVECYTAAKVYISRALVVTNATPGGGWVRYQRRVGPAGDVVFPALTRYVRIVADLQNNAALNNDWAYVDDIQFQQEKAAQSSTLSLTTATRLDTVGQAFNLQAWTQWGTSVMTLTTTEQGYIWAWFNMTMIATVARTFVAQIKMYVNAAATIHLIYMGEYVANGLVPVTLGGRTQSVAAGVNTVSIYVYVQNVGDVVTGGLLTGSCFWHRAN